MKNKTMMSSFNNIPPKANELHTVKNKVWKGRSKKEKKRRKKRRGGGKKGKGEGKVEVGRRASDKLEEEVPDQWNNVTILLEMTTLP